MPRATKQSLAAIAAQMMRKGKGLLAADETAPTIDKRLAAVGVEQNEEARRKFRQLLFTAPGAEKYVSGVILFESTLRQKTDTGVSFVELLVDKGIVPGIKVDKGKIDLPQFPGEQVTIGLDDLDVRLREFYDIGMRFAKWRAVVPIGKGLPHPEAIDANAHALARYAALCQEAGIVPMIEPEVLIDGDHTIDQCERVLRATLGSVFHEIEKYRVDLAGTILKTSMVLSGKERAVDAPALVADKTVSVLSDMVPREIAGVVFLSGGQFPEQATANLNAIMARGPHPWPVTFSYARALQDPVLEAWEGIDANISAAQKAYVHRLAMNAAALEGAYMPDMEHAISK